MSSKIKIANTLLPLIMIISTLFSCSSILSNKSASTAETRWDFNSLSGWIDGSHNMN